MTPAVARKKFRIRLLMGLIAFVLFGYMVLSLWLSILTYHDPNTDYWWEDLGLVACVALGVAAGLLIRVVNSDYLDIANLPPRSPDIDPLRDIS